jgi:hypothetical protein
MSGGCCQEPPRNVAEWRKLTVAQFAGGEMTLLSLSVIAVPTIVV